MRKLFKKHKKSPKIIKIDLRDLETEFIFMLSNDMNKIVFQGKIYSIDLSCAPGQREERFRLEFYSE